MPGQLTGRVQQRNPRTVPKVALATGVFALFAGEVSAQGRPGGGGGGGQCNKGGSSTSQLQSRSMPNTQAVNTALYSQYAGVRSNQSQLMAAQQQYNQLVAAQMQYNQLAAAQLQNNQLAAAQLQAAQDYKARVTQRQAAQFWDYQRRGAP